MNNWLIWALLSALFAGLTAVLAKVGVQSVDANLATAIRTTVILVFTWLLASMSMGRGAIASINPRTWTFLALSGIATGLSWLCYFRALQLGPVSKVAPIDKLSVAVAIAISVLFLGERLGVRESCGIALVVAGALVLGWK